MTWRIRQRLGGVLLVLLVSVNLVYSFTNETLEEIPEMFANMSGGNTLWDSLLRECKNASLSCVQNRVYNYVDDVLDTTDTYEIDGFLRVRRNNVSYEELEQINEITNRDDDGAERSEATDPLQDKAVKFMMTHDMEVQMPETIFEGSTLQVSPRGFEDNGFIARFALIPKALKKNIGTPRILFKKIQKFIGEKLMNALLAILLVISMLSVKFLWFMPMVMGAAAAKKILLKILLFFFPFLAYILKLCPYYDAHGGATKFHHHHHQISHLHHVPPSTVHTLKHPPTIISDHPPDLHDHDFHGYHEHHPHYDIDLQYNSDGPDFTNELISHRKDHQPAVTENENNLYSWIAGAIQGPDPSKRPRKPQTNRPLTPVEIENLALKAEKEAVLKVRLQKEHQRVQLENKQLQEQIQKGLKIQEKLRQQAVSMQKRRPENVPPLVPGVLAGPMSGVVQPSQVLRTPPAVGPTHHLQNQKHNFHVPFVQPPAFQQTPAIQQSPVFQQPPAFQQPAAFQQSAVLQQPVALQQQQTVSTTYDPFYSPILEKIDKILVGIGFAEEPCRERLICSMYKNPTKFSPHSNLISTQLSRDANELQKPTSTNAAVIRFYRYVQAARDGQDKRECLRLYPSCAINTEL